MSKVKLSELLFRVKEPINLCDMDEYKRVTIKMNNLGVVLRDRKLGSEIGTKKQFLIKEGFFVLSKIDARNGAFGIVPKELTDAIITGNFWAYKVNKELLNAEWFNLFVASPSFIKICDIASSGTTNRKYLDENKFLNIEINLPTLEEQIKIVESTQNKLFVVNKIKEEILNQLDEVGKLRNAILQEMIEEIL